MAVADAVSRQGSTAVGRVLRGTANIDLLVVIHLQTSCEQLVSRSIDSDELVVILIVVLEIRRLQHDLRSRQRDEAVLALARGRLFENFLSKWLVRLVAQAVAVVLLVLTTFDNLLDLVVPSLIETVACAGWLRARASIHYCGGGCFVPGANWRSLVVEIVVHSQEGLKTRESETASLFHSVKVDDTVVSAAFPQTFIHGAMLSLSLGATTAFHCWQPVGHVVVQLMSRVALFSLAIAVKRFRVARVLTSGDASRNISGTSFLHNGCFLIGEYLHLGEAGIACAHLLFFGNAITGGRVHLSAMNGFAVSETGMASDFLSRNHQKKGKKEE